MIVVGTPGNFFTVYLRQTVRVDISWFQIFNPAASVGSMLGAFLVGYLIDHVNMRSAFLTAFSMALASLTLIFFFPQPPYPALAFACAGFFGSFVPVGTMTMILNLTDKRESTVRIGLFNTLMVPFQLFASGSMGWLAEKVGFEWIFLIAALACGAAFWILAVRAPFEKTQKSS
jgi:MFS family permease